VSLSGLPQTFEGAEVVGVDFVHTHNPEVVFDLNQKPWTFAREGEFDEVHAYDLLEHLGAQGDFKTFFDDFYEIWRVLKVGGLLYALCPWWQSEWAWADPGHTRIISPYTLTYLDKKEYRNQIGRTSMTDYRGWWNGNFQYFHGEQMGDAFVFVLRKKERDG
jgi:hypothetical protein